METKISLAEQVGHCYPLDGIKATWDKVQALLKLRPDANAGHKAMIDLIDRAKLAKDRFDPFQDTDILKTLRSEQATTFAKTQLSAGLQTLDSLCDSPRHSALTPSLIVVRTCGGLAMEKGNEVGKEILLESFDEDFQKYPFWAIWRACKRHRTSIAHGSWFPKGADLFRSLPPELEKLNLARRRLKQIQDVLNNPEKHTEATRETEKDRKFVLEQTLEQTLAKFDAELRQGCYQSYNPRTGEPIKIPYTKPAAVHLALRKLVAKAVKRK